MSLEKSSIDTPYLSLVVTTRNDDHGGDPLKRLRAFINTFAAQCLRTGLDAEVIVVEWNPPPDRPYVRELLRIPADAPCAVRFVDVPPEVHATFRYAAVLPLFQMIAKNVGIRRARGRFILCTNIDVIFSNELVEHLASRTLVAGRMYRVDRHDIEPDFPVEGRLDEQMAYCRTHHLRLHQQSGTHPVDPSCRLKVLEPDIVGSGVTLAEGWHVREGDVTFGFYRWATREARFAVDRTAAPALVRGAVLDVEVEPNPYQPDSWVDLEILDGERQLARRRVSSRTRLRITLEDGVARHEIVMRTIDSSGGREYLPLLQCREQLCYRVWHVSAETEPSYLYDMALWRRNNNSPKLLVQQTPTSVDITTDPGSYSYCVQYGAFEAPADGRYQFLLEYEAAEGRFSFAPLDDERGTWLPSTVVDIERDGVRLFGLSVEIPHGTRFSLLVSNDRPGGGVSRFVLRRLLGSVPRVALARKDPGATLMLMRRLLTVNSELLLKPFRLLGSAISLIEQRRARRFENTITEESDRVRELEARLASLAPLSDLAALARLLREHRPVELHQNGCGDFQLMAREHWLALRGYPEIEMFSMSIDGVLEALAYSAGVREHVFEAPLCAYHLEHEKGSGWTPEGEALLKKRIAESGIPWLDAGTVHIWTMYMQWLNRPMIFNGSGWGLGEVTLPETTLQPVAGNA